MPLYSIVYRPITHFMGLSQEAMDTLTGVAEGLGYTAAGGGYDQIFLTDFIHQHWADFQGTVEGLIDVTSASWAGSEPRTHQHVQRLPVRVVLHRRHPDPRYRRRSPVFQQQDHGPHQRPDRRAEQPDADDEHHHALISLWFCFSMPAAMGLYWIVNSVFMTLQEVILGKFYTKRIQAEEEEREAKREAVRQARMEEARKRAAEQKELEAKKPKKPQPKPKENRVSTNEAGRVGDRPYARAAAIRRTGMTRRSKTKE